MLNFVVELQHLTVWASPAQGGVAVAATAKARMVRIDLNCILDKVENGGLKNTLKVGV